MNDDAKFDAWLHDAASGYNQPGDVPRDAMWRAIQPAIARRATPVTPLRESLLRRWVPLAAAAVLLVVVSYQVGRSRGATGPAPSNRVAVAPAPAPTGDTVLYARVTEQHFGRADALLTTLRTRTTADSMDTAMLRWARELLTDTRLLIDSPASTDPVRRRLLQDLELALAQIVQLSAAATPDDQALVRRSLQRGELLTRIRSAVPPALSGT